MKRAVALPGIAIALLFVCANLFSQTNQGTIQGAVFDQSGGAIAGATVSVIDVARGVSRALTTDGAGQYIANDLNPGTYHSAGGGERASGTVEHSGVLVEVGQNVRVDLTGAARRADPDDYRHRRRSRRSIPPTLLWAGRSATNRLTRCR